MVTMVITVILDITAITDTKARVRWRAGAVEANGAWATNHVVIEYALAQLLMQWGIRPQAMLGYSLGEYVAACLAGVLSLEDTLLLVVRRAQLISELPAGTMIAVSLFRGRRTYLHR